jgi:hypothetical protein
MKTATGWRARFGRKRQLTPPQNNHARKLIDDGLRREDTAALLNAYRTNVYKSLAA